MAFNDTDLERIAASLSETDGVFPVSNLVNYGSTLLVRPGARTTNGVVFSGAQIAAMLPDAYVAFPLAVEYAAEPMPDLTTDLAGLEADVMGATALKERNLRSRYARVTERFRYRVARFRMNRQLPRLKRAQRALRRLEQIWAKMGQKGVSRQGLVSPATLAAELRGLKVAPSIRVIPARPAPAVRTRFPATRPTAPAVRVTPTYAPTAVTSAPTATASSPVAAPIPAPAAPAAPAASSTYTPVSKKVSALYLKDQAELEKELAQSTPSYYGATDHATAQECLAADLRAETIGYLFGPVEHDYYGIDAGDDIEFTSADFLGLVDGTAGDRLAAFAADGVENLEASSMIDIFDGVLASSRMLARADRLGAVRPDLASRMRSKALATMNAASLAKLGADDMDAEEIEDAEVDDVEDEVEVETERSPQKAAPVSEEQSKAANLQRRALLPSASELRAVREGQDVLEKAERAAKVITKITDALRSVSPNGSVNYARLVPASGFGADEPIVVIGIQKRTGVPDSLLDLLYEEEIERIPSGYTAQDAVRAITENTSVSDYLGDEGLLSSLVAEMNDVEETLYGPVLYGSASTLLATMNEAEDAVYGPVLYGAANAYPNGDAPPLPPPRRVGAEVYGA